MPVFVVHDPDGNVVGMVRAQQDDAPPVVMSATPGHIVTEIGSPDEVEAVYRETDENGAVEAARVFSMDVKARLMRR